MSMMGDYTEGVEKHVSDRQILRRIHLIMFGLLIFLFFCLYRTTFFSWRLMATFQVLENLQGDYRVFCLSDFASEIFFPFFIPS